MNMKHAYLIIAHNEFEVLRQLISVLDDERNDIFVHIDKKIKVLPRLECRNSNLHIIKDRVDVRWGHISQIECEYKLFESSFLPNKYDRFHLISGTHLPLKSQDELYAFFNNISGKELITSIYTDAYEAKFKLGVYHFFVKNYMAPEKFNRSCSVLLENLSVKMQLALGIHRDSSPFTHKAANWVSLSSNAMEYVVNKKDSILKRFNQTFCGDEFFVPYLLNMDKGRFEIVDNDQWLYHDFDGSRPRVLNEDDYEFLINSNYLFARKFSSSGMNIVNKIVNYVKQKE